MNFNPYFNNKEFQKNKYIDQPTLQLLDWAQKRIQAKRSHEKPEALRENLKRLLLDPIEADLAGLDIDMAITGEQSVNDRKNIDLCLNIGQLVESRATLTLPSSRKIDSPVFICLHGHHHEGRHWSLEKGPAAVLSQAGYVCLAPDLLGLGDSRGDTEDTDRSAIAYDLLTHNALLLGWSLNGLRIWTLKQWMRKLKELNTSGFQEKHFACAGFSLGGELALYLSALNPEIEPVYISHYGCPWEESYWTKLHCKCAYIPGLMRKASLIDLFKLIVPRVLAVEASREDSSFPFEGTERMIQQLKEYYMKHSAENHFHYLVKNGDHEFHCDPKTLSFLAQHIPE